MEALCRMVSVGRGQKKSLGHMWRELLSFFRSGSSPGRACRSKTKSNLLPPLVLPPTHRQPASLPRIPLNMHHPVLSLVGPPALPRPRSRSRRIIGAHLWRRAPPSSPTTQNNPRNRLSKFQYTKGNAAATRNSEEILLTTIPKATGIHAAGWLDFPPAAFANVSHEDARLSV